MQNLLNNIKRYVDLNNREASAFEDIVELRELKKKEFLLEPGKVCQHQSYVNKGALRSYLIDTNGEEHTVQFAIEDWFISDFSSYIDQKPGSLHIEAMENSELFQISYDKTEKLCADYPVFERYFRLVAQKAFAFSQKRILSKIGLSAEERFLEFNEMYPQIVKRVPQYALASYLGMSPEFLSKIRKRIER